MTFDTLVNAQTHSFWSGYTISSACRAKDTFESRKKPLVTNIRQKYSTYLSKKNVSTETVALRITWNEKRFEMSSRSTILPTYHANVHWHTVGHYVWNKLMDQ